MVAQKITKSTSAAGKKLRVDTAVKRPAAPAKKASARSGVRVAVAVVGGYKVFGSPIEPTHRTASQIAEAVADLV